MGIMIAGGPRTGKTTLAKTMGPALSTDDLMDLPWSDVPDAVIDWMDRPGFIIEGVQVPRTLRRWMQQNNGRPCNVVIWLEAAKVERSPRQNSMAKAVSTVFKGIVPELRRRGVTIINRDAPAGLRPRG